MLENSLNGSIQTVSALVLTVASIDATAEFYQRVLGMRRISFAGGRTALRFGRQKINLHQAGAEVEPKAAHPTPGSGDLCFISDTPMEEITAHLSAGKVPIELGPVRRTGAEGAILSVYVRDPDGNLIEISNVHDVTE
ncbi:VOC family protein [Minwuia sp.]|uniref:VOC family protein n=1 Tax=Minwuia sp. TaxID=2493630 RepID=UPI003A9086A0